MKRFYKCVRWIIMVVVLNVGLLPFCNGQGIGLWQLDNAPDSNYIIKSIDGGEWYPMFIDSFFAKYGTGGGGGSGTVTSITAASPLTGGTITTTGTIDIQNATAYQDGALTSTDWNLFNNKVGGSGSSNRLAWWNGTNIVTSSGKLLYDDSSAKMYLGSTLDTASSWITPNAGLAIRGTGSAGLTLTTTGGAYDWWQAFIDDNSSAGRFALWNDATSPWGGEVFTIKYSTGQPSFKYWTQTTSGPSANDRVVIGNVSSGDTKVLNSAGTDGQVLGKASGLIAWVTPSSGGITSLNGSTASTQTFAYSDGPGTTPSWNTASGVHTFRLPAGSNGQVLKHNGTDWIAGTDQTGTGSGLADGAMAVVNGLGNTNATVGSYSKINFNNAVNWNVSGGITATAGNTDNISVNGEGNYLIIATGSFKATCGDADYIFSIYADGAAIDIGTCYINNVIDEDWHEFSISTISIHTAADPNSVYDLRVTNSYPAGWQCATATTYILEVQGLSFQIHKIY